MEVGAKEARPLELEQRSDLEVIRVRLGQLMDLGSALAGLGWPVVVRTDRPPRACSPAPGRWGEEPWK